jgi:hypothetical protein
MSDTASKQQIERFEHKPTLFVGVMPSGTYVFIGIDKRDEFDRIDAPVCDNGENQNGHVLTKSIDNGVVTVVFQYWLKSRTYEAISADMAAERVARAAAVKESGVAC